MIHVETRRGRPLVVQPLDRVANPLDFLASQRLTETHLSSPNAIGAISITVEDPTNAAPGKYIEMWENGAFYQGEIKSVDGSTIGLHLPMGLPFSTSANCFIVNVDMNIAGGTPSAPHVFKFAPGDQCDVDFYITRFIVQITQNLAGDDSKYGDLAQLSNGLYIGGKGTIQGIPIYNNLFAIRSNGDYKIRSYDLSYNDKAGPGVYGVSARKTFNGPDKSGTVIPNRRATKEEALMCVQDDLSGLISHRISIHGYVAAE